MGTLERAAASVRYSCRGSQRFVLLGWLTFVLVREYERCWGYVRLAGPVGDFFGDYVTLVLWVAVLALGYWFADGDARRPTGVGEPPLVVEGVQGRSVPGLSGVRPKVLADQSVVDWVE